MHESLPEGWPELARSIVSLAAAFVLGVPVGWDRERQRLGPGLRTYPLLAMGACAYIEIAQAAFQGDVEMQSRVFQGLISGVGFIGAGAIIKGHHDVHGLATAVSLWITVGVGIAAAYELFALAAVLSAATLTALRVLKPLKRDPESADAVVEERGSS
jgi:putative Mg2+ transporter-C (MgtC) family protein